MISIYRISKKGTASVFLVMILASILLLVSLFIHAASRVAGNSYADAVLDLSGRSVLSEYNLELQKRYGIFAVHTDESQAEAKIKYYADYSFHNNVLKEVMRSKDYTDTLKLNLDSVRVYLKGYSITDIDLFEQQVAAYMKYAVIKPERKKVRQDSAGANTFVLRNEQVINCLPSKGYQSSFFTDLESKVKNGVPDLEEIKTSAQNIYLADEYILEHFTNHRYGHETRDTFFLNEVEYVLKGNYNDKSNYNAVRSDLFIMRNGMNLLHINSDPEKRHKVEMIAAALTLAEGKEIGAIAVAEAWAAAESENDLRLLEDGKQVSFIKKKENWAVPISDTLEYLWKEGYAEPAVVDGYDYEDYLRILLFLENREKKLLRCMDLIQMNMKGSYDQNFDLREYYGGFQFEAVVNERTFTYIEKY